MRHLAQPKVVLSSAISAAASTLLCLPRFLLLEDRKFSVAYFAAVAFFGGFVLWAFVFAWHTEYTKRPIFTLNINPLIFTASTLVAVLVAIVLSAFLDPTLRRVVPQDYPPDLPHWIASGLFALAITQLILVYAPFAWSMRLFRNERIATWFTVTFSVVVLILQTRSAPKPLPTSILLELLSLRIVLNFSAVWFYLRGGMLLVWWIGLIVEARNLLGIYK